MAGPIHDLMAQWPDLRGQIDPSFGANANNEHRHKIRESIARNLNLPIAEISDLSRPPETASWSISISHCPNLGGWVAIPRPATVGLDIEEKDRLRPEVIRRVSSENELKEAPHPAYLWCAKESHFKAVHANKNLTIGAIQISEWRPQSHGFHFSGESRSSRSNGFLTEYNGFIIAVTVSN